MKIKCSKWNNGYNTVLTGEAGSGKSWTVENEILAKYSEDCRIALTGMTGLASCNIKGQTIHSWLNLGLINCNPKEKDNGKQSIINRIVFNPRNTWEHVKAVDTIIIDEISMCDALTFDVIDGVLKYIRRNNMPFGGIQMILVGDNYQLPPVKAKELGYYFQSKAYQNGNFQAVVLREQHRQAKGQFLNILNRVRIGKATQRDIDYLNRQKVKDSNDIPIDSVILFPRNIDVDNANMLYFESIDKPIDKFYSRDIKHTLPFDTNVNIDYSKQLRVPSVLELKEGCQILLLSNLDVVNGIVNGSQGVYLGKIFDKLKCEFNGEEVLVPKVKFEVYRHDELVFEREQYPIVLGRALSIHKAQGMTLNNVYIDFTRIFAPHQSYVALSRVKSIEGLHINGLTLDKIWVDRNVVKYMNELEKV